MGNTRFNPWERWLSSSDYRRKETEEMGNTGFNP
jgi:hypothetical protein